MNPVSVSFEVVEIWKNVERDKPYTLEPRSGLSQKVYAVKIGYDYFILGNEGDGVYICDNEEIE